MKKSLANFLFLLCTLSLVSSCEKQDIKKSTGEATASVSEQNTASAACLPVYYQLVVDPGSGNSFIFKTSGSPTALPVTLSAFFGSCGDNAIRLIGSCTPITFVTGIATDPSGTVLWGTTGPASNVPNSLLRIPIADVSLSSPVPLVSSCGIVLNVSDIEYNTVNGRFYAINRGAPAVNNRIVQIQPTAVTNVICLTATVPVNRRLRGLTFGCNGQGYVMQTSGPNGKIWSFNLASGATGAPTCNYGLVAPGAPAATAPEMGLHFDCSCIGKFITGNYDPVPGTTLLTDGMPVCIGAPSYLSLTGVIKPTVDFAKP